MANELLNNEVLSINVVAKSDIDAKELTHSNELLAGLISANNTLITAKSEMCGFIAQLDSVEAYKNYKDVKSINQLVIEVLDCSKSYASEMVKVAKNFYNSDGALITLAQGLTFSDMKLLSDLEKDVREKAVDLLNQLDNHTRSNTEDLCKYIKDGKSLDVITLAPDKKHFLIEDKAETTEQETSEQESEQESEQTSEQESEQASEQESEQSEQESEQPSAQVLTKATVEVIFNDLLSLEKDFDKESKTNLKKRLHDITIKLGELSK